jgi:hypothetical protein
LIGGNNLVLPNAPLKPSGSRLWKRQSETKMNRSLVALALGARTGVLSSSNPVLLAKLANSEAGQALPEIENTCDHMVINSR